MLPAFYFDNNSCLYFVCFARPCIWEMRELTGVLEVDVISIVGILQLVGHDTQSHDLLPYQRVRPCDVHIHLWVVHLVGEALFHHLREISGHGDAA